MKRIGLAFAILWCSVSSFARFEVVDKASVPLEDQAGVDYVILIDGIDANTELRYAAPYTTINWYVYSDDNRHVSNLDYISPEDATGYRLEVDDKEVYVWVFDYQQYLPAFTELTADPANETPCEAVVFRCNEEAVPAMRYMGKDGQMRTLSREFTLTYNTKVYEDGTKDWGDKSLTETVVFSLGNTITLDSEENLPLDPASTFVLSGDQYAAALGRKPMEFTATPPAVFPVRSRLTSVVTVREEKNEISRPSEAEPTPPIKGSAPLDISFESRPSDPDALFDWRVYRGDELLLTRTDRDLRYTFEEYGTYWVKLRVYRDPMDLAGACEECSCAVTDSVEVSVAESFLGVPNVFTPNGDGKNDEFRVAYRSLASFHCWVYSNWGKLVYEWSDPSKGWDGRINGRKNAPAGTYFYIIKAEGTDGEKWNVKGDINIIR